jgi:tetratricopeptide (TPR) repeat protein
MTRALLSLFLIGSAASAWAQEGSSSDAGRYRQALLHYRAGLDQLNHEGWEDAVREFAAAIDLDPLLLDAHYGLGRAQMALGRYVAAERALLGCEEAFRQLEELKGKGAIASEQRVDDEIFELENLRMRWQSRPETDPLKQSSLVRIETQVQELRRMRGRGSSGPLPRPAQCTLSLGSTYFHMNRLEDAERAYLEAIKSRPSLGEAHNNLAVVYGLKLRYEDAMREVRLAEKNGFHVNAEFKRMLTSPAPTGAEPPTTQALAALRDDTLNLAYPQLVARYRDDPDGALLALAETPAATVVARLERVKTPEGRGDLKDRDLAAAALLHTDLSFRQLRQGAAALGNDNLGIARSLMALVLDPEVAGTMVKPWFQAVAHESQSRLATSRALQLLDDGLKLFPNDPGLLLSRAAIHEARSLSEPSGARASLKDIEEEYRHVLGAEPESEEAHLRLGRVLAEQGQAEDARHAFTWVLEHARHEGRLYLAQLFLGRLEEDRGRLAEAITAYRSALDVDPGGQSASLALSHALALSGDPRAGLEILQRTLVHQGKGALHPDPWWRYQYGLLTDGEAAWDNLRARLASS